MQWGELTIHNFLSISKAVIPLHGMGLCLITGENKDAPKQASNGAGKSTLLDALCWCLWGRTVRDLKNDAVVHRHVGKNCLVKVTFEDNGQKYEVIRTRKVKKKGIKPNDLIFKINGVAPSKDSSMAETQALVTKAVGMEYDTFCVMMPGAGINLAAMSDAYVKERLEKVLQLEALAKARELVKKDLAEQQKDLLVLNSRIEKNDALLKAKTESLQQYEALQDQRGTQQAVRAAEAFGRLWAVQDRLDAAESHLARKPGIERLVHNLSNAKDNALDDLCALNKEFSKRTREFSTERNQYEVKKGTNAKEIERLTKLVVFFDQLHHCSTCEQEVGDEHKEKVKAKLQDDISLLEKQQALVEAAFEGVKKTYDAYQTKVSIDQQRLDGIVRTMDKDAAPLKAQLSDFKVYQERKTQAQKQFVQLQQEIKNIQAEKSEFGPYIKELQKEKKKLAKQSDKFLIDRDKIAEKIKQLSFWVDGFAPAGIRSYMLEHVTPILNERAKYYCKELTDNEMQIQFHTKTETKTAGVKEKFRIDVEFASGGESYTAVSTGEKRRADFVVALVLGDLAALRANKLIPFRFMDEPFESVDDIGTEEIVKLLNQHKAKYDTVYVITHKPALQQLFTKRIHVVKQNKNSTLEILT